eukprot:s1382_g22.t1
MSDRVPRALRADNTMDDIFCMIKEKMASDGLCQAPLLVLPGSLLEQSKEMLRRANDRSCPLQTCHLDDERRQELRMLKVAIGQASGPIEQLRAYFESAIENLVEKNPYAKFERSFLTLTPNESMEEFWLPLNAFDYSEKGKNGCEGFGKP